MELAILRDLFLLEGGIVALSTILALGVFILRNAIFGKHTVFLPLSIIVVVGLWSDLYSAAPPQVTCVPSGCATPYIWDWTLLCAVLPILLIAVVWGTWDIIHMIFTGFPTPTTTKTDS